MAKRAGAKAPDEARQSEIDSLLSAAVAAHQAGRLDEAESGYRAVLAMAPRNPDALQFLGVLSHMRDRSQEAIQLLKRAVRAAPRYAAAHDNLARVLRESGQPKAALKHHARAIFFDPLPPSPYTNLAVTFQELDQLPEADAAMAEAIARQPDNGPYYLYRGRLQLKLRRYEAALATLEEAVKLGHNDANVTIADLLVAIGDREKAVALLKRWLDSQPDDPIARHMYAAFSGENPPERASAPYVREVFDKFATSFDMTLDRLGYRAPELLGQVVGQFYESATGDRAILDLGCGTGLCGPLLKPFASHLIGVDLSVNMLRRAHARGLYDELEAAEITRYMFEHHDSFDAAVAADVLCYFGDLTEAANAAFAALRPSGLLAFTVEHDEGEDRAGYALREHGRYAHAEPYVRRTLEAAGFVDIRIATDTLRRERDDMVRGLVVHATRP